MSIGIPIDRAVSASKYLESKQEEIERLMRVGDVGDKSTRTVYTSQDRKKLTKKIRHMRTKGMTYAAISEELEIHIRTVIRWSKSK